MKVADKRRVELATVLRDLDWIKILKSAIEMRTSSWGDHPVREWRNAGDCVLFAVLQALREKEMVP